MPRSTTAKSCSSVMEAIAPAGGARERLSKRGQATKICIGHDYIETVRAARRRKHANKQSRLMNELRAMLLEMKAVLQPEPPAKATQANGSGKKRTRKRRQASSAAAGGQSSKVG
jgi:hypothetical protein